MIRTCSALALALALTSCVTTGGDQQAAAKVNFDRMCAAEPALYLAYVTVATSKGFSEAKMRKAEAIHESIGVICSGRPDNFVAALVTLTTAYAKFVAINNDAERA